MSIFIFFSLNQTAFGQCDIPRFKASTLGERESCDPIDFKYKLEEYLDNPPDTRYNINFGDGESDSFLQSDLDSSGVQIISHTYSKVSCELVGNKGFEVIITAERTECEARPNEFRISPVVIGRKPTTNFTTNPKPGCVDKQVVFVNETINGFGIGLSCSTEATFTWDFGDGSDPFITESKNSFTHIYTSPGVYNVKLKADHSCGLDSITKQVVINEIPRPVFEIKERGGSEHSEIIDSCLVTPKIFELQGQVCAPLELDLKNLSDPNNGQQYTWTVESSSKNNSAAFSTGNDTSTEVDEVIRFEASGRYLITLIAENTCGSEFSCVEVNIIDIPSQDNIEIFGLEELCGPKDFDLSVDQPNAIAINWSYKGMEGTPDPSIPNNSDTANPDPLTNLPLGKYEVSVTVTNACGTGTAKEVFEVVSVPIIGIDTSFLELCAGDVGILTATGDTDVAYQWFRNGVLMNGEVGSSIQVADSAVYSVMALKVRCNSISEGVPVTVRPLPQVELVDQITCVLTDSIVLTANPLQAGNGVWSSPDVPANALTADGVFYPQLAGINTEGFNLIYTFTETGNSKNCTQSFSKKVIVYPGPKPEFEADLFVCVNSEVDFTNLTPEIVGLDITWQWRFGDGGTSTEKNPTYIYSDTASNVQVTLIATTSAGCSDSISSTINVILDPVANFSTSFEPLDSCGPLNVDFINESTGKGMSYFWDFGNGLTSTEENPQNIIYQASAFDDTTYIAKLSVSNACTTVDYTQPIRVKATSRSNFVFEFDTVCTGYNMSIFNFSIGEPKSFIWDFGDGSPLLTTTDTGFVSHTFQYNGNSDTTYMVSLVTEGDCGFDTLVRPLVVVPVAITSFFSVSTDNGCVPVTVDFISNQPGRTTLIWDSGDGKSNSVEVGGLERTYTYTEPGEYTASLVVISGCNIDTFSRVITVTATPEGDFALDELVCTGEGVVFENLTPAPMPTTWDFGDGTTFTGLNPPPKVYARNGTYTVTMEVRDPLNAECPKIVRKTVDVVPFPTADFEVLENTVCESEPFGITNISSNAQSFYWEFENKFPPSIEESPTVALNGNGIVRITLVAFSGPNQTGCSDTLTQSINVAERPRPEFSITTEVECGVMFVNFENLTTFPANSFEGTLRWDFGNGQTFQGFENIPMQAYENFGEDGSVFHNIKLQATSNAGCTDVFTYELAFEGCCRPTVELPEGGKSLAFTPYNGGENERFRLKHEYVETFSMEVYNKWGVMVFKTDDPDASWDGYYNGSKCETGVYQVKVVLGGCSRGKITQEKPILFQLHLLD